MLLVAIILESSNHQRSPLRPAPDIDPALVCHSTDSVSEPRTGSTQLVSTHLSLVSEEAQASAHQQWNLVGLIKLERALDIKTATVCLTILFFAEEYP